MHDRLEIDGVSKVYASSGGRVDALSGVDLTIEPGEFVTLFGPSGCGKSTLLRIISGLETQSEGEVSIFGISVREAVERKNVAWIPQSSALLPWLSIRNNAALSSVVNRRADRSGRSARMAEDPTAVLAEVGLRDFEASLPEQLSGGMRQRASIARGFVHGAPLMLMDEPFSALDELTRDTLRLQLLQMWERHRRTIVFVTHSAAEAVLLSDRVVVMTPRPGRIHGIVEVDLPRPRGDEVAESAQFERTVREVKRMLRSGWTGE